MYFYFMPVVSAKSIYQQIFDTIEPFYGKRESGSLAAAYLFDRWHIDRIKLSMNMELAIDDHMFRSDLRKLRQGMPLQHVVGFQEFYGHRFQTNHHALIPRPETEELVEWIVETVSDRYPELLTASSINLMDIGTGTGCIPIAIDLALEHVDCLGVDISKEALKLSETNAKRLGSNARFNELDILKEDLTPEAFDIIISNPPYIPESDKTQMHENVLNFEPELALFVSNDDPLVFYREIGKKASSGLKINGLLFFEIHELFGDKIITLLNDMGYKDVELRNDINGKPRMVRCAKC